MPQSRANRGPSGRQRRRAAQLVRQIVGGWRCQALHTAVQLGLPERLAQEPVCAGRLATELQCQVDALTRLLRALCTLGVCRERTDGRFALTAGGRLLCPRNDDADLSLRALVQWWAGALWPMWADLTYSVRSGRSAREKLSGDECYGFLERSAEQAQLFHEAQRAMTTLILDDLTRWPGWQGAQHLVDVGGGHGQLALAVAAAHPGLRATVLDLPHAEAGGRHHVESASLGRCRFEAGSFFERVPPAGDRYVLKSILHNWDDAHCRQILQRCRDAMPAGAQLLIVERVRPPRLRRSPHDEAVARTDLNMLAGLGGRERSLDEYAALLRSAGFVAGAVTPLAFEFSLVEASPVQRDRA